MKEIKITSRFKKDLKRIQNAPERILRVKEVLKILQETGTLPKQYKPHMLVGDYNGCMECHVENDLLLIWIDEKAELIKLIRLGSHSELF